MFLTKLSRGSYTLFMTVIFPSVYGQICVLGQMYMSPRNPAHLFVLKLNNPLWDSLISFLSTINQVFIHWCNAAIVGFFFSIFSSSSKCSFINVPCLRLSSQRILHPGCSQDTYSTTFLFILGFHSGAGKCSRLLSTKGLPGPYSPFALLGWFTPSPSTLRD